MSTNDVIKRESYKQMEMEAPTSRHHRRNFGSMCFRREVITQKDETIQTVEEKDWKRLRYYDLKCCVSAHQQGSAKASRGREADTCLCTNKTRKRLEPRTEERSNVSKKQRLLSSQESEKLK